MLRAAGLCTTNLWDPPAPGPRRAWPPGRACARAARRAVAVAPSPGRVAKRRGKGERVAVARLRFDRSFIPPAQKHADFF